MAKEFFIHCASPKYQIKLHSTYVGSWSHNLNYVPALSGYVIALYKSTFTYLLT